MIEPLNASEVTKAVVVMLHDAATVGGEGVRVERSEEWDTQPETKGWVGVYRESQRFPPRVLGMGSGFREQRVGLVALIRESNHASGADCEDALELLLQRVVSVLLSDPTLRGTVHNLADEFEVRYDKYDKVGGVFVQTAALFFTGVVQVRHVS